MSDDQEQPQQQNETANHQGEAALAPPWGFGDHDPPSSGKDSPPPPEPVVEDSESQVTSSVPEVVEPRPVSPTVEEVDQPQPEMPPELVETVPEAGGPPQELRAEIEELPSLCSAEELATSTSSNHKEVEAANRVFDEAMTNAADTEPIPAQPPNLSEEESQLKETPPSATKPDSERSRKASETAPTAVFAGGAVSASTSKSSLNRSSVGSKSRSRSGSKERLLSKLADSENAPVTSHDEDEVNGNSC